MHQFFVDPTQIRENIITITGKDVKQIKNVLRMRAGEEVAISDGITAKEYRCVIETIDTDCVICQLIFIKEADLELPSKVYLFQGLPKADKMELIIQKAVELGVYEIIPVASARAVVKLDEKKEQTKLARWQGIAEAAAKQSKRRIIPVVSSVLTFEAAVAVASQMDVKIIPYEMAGDMEKTKQLIGSIGVNQEIAVFIGPEGGFAENEIGDAMAAGIIPVTMGKRILRTETAGMTMLGWIMYQLEG
ncbi:MAG: 16S rRNA (uracil(1498)-N(3))-methyltransferase [Lachnospiraceae bacterium]|jgi:16S rRNA (uracil1498-N3)-methyltransferase|nr:16S rRNA (uracil(1498)-N(3))-methyltransferase [Lachnospiraceae bacterium]